jgi:crossover junction endodeoxyribonuclease RusA
MSLPIHIDVIGVPQPQGSKQGFIRGGRVNLVDPKGVKPWREAIAQAGRDWQAEHQQPLLDVPLEVTITFRLPKPKSSPKRRIHPDTKPDLDKLDRAVLDAITGVLITNDSRVVMIHSRKVFAIDGPPGAAIEIRPADAA